MNRDNFGLDYYFDNINMDIDYIDLFFIKQRMRIWNIELGYLGREQLSIGLIIGASLCHQHIALPGNIDHFMLRYYNNEEKDRNYNPIILEDYIFTISDIKYPFSWGGKVILENVPVNEITHSYTIKNTNFTYSVWLLIGNNTANLYEFHENNDIAEFLRGILTICNAFNLDPARIILACPLHDGYPYYIEGITLPILPPFPGMDLIFPIDDDGKIFQMLPYNQIGDVFNDDELYNNNDHDGWDNDRYGTTDDDNYYDYVHGDFDKQLRDEQEERERNYDPLYGYLF